MRPEAARNQVYEGPFMAGIKIGLDPTCGRWPLTTLGRTSTRFPRQSSFCDGCRGRAGEGEVSRAACRPVRKEAAARRHNQAWTEAKAATAQDSAGRVSADSVAQSVKVRGGQGRCSGLVQEADARAHKGNKTC